MSFGERFERAIEERGLSKYKVSKIAGVSPSTLTNWISEITTPDNAKLNVVCKHLKIDKNWLLTGEGYKPYEVDSEVEAIDPVVTERLEATYMSPDSVMMVPLVQQYEYPTYMVRYGDQRYIGGLPQIPFWEEQEYKGKYLCFEVRSDAMDDGTKRSYDQGDVVLCRQIDREHWKDILRVKLLSDFVILSEADGVLIKQVSAYDAKKETVTLHSYNLFYPDKEIALSDIQVLFLIVKSIKSKLGR